MSHLTQIYLQTFPAGVTELFFNENSMYYLQSEKEQLFLVIPTLFLYSLEIDCTQEGILVYEVKR